MAVIVLIIYYMCFISRRAFPGTYIAWTHGLIKIFPGTYNYWIHSLIRITSITLLVLFAHLMILLSALNLTFSLMSEPKILGMP